MTRPSSSPTSRSLGSSESFFAWTQATFGALTLAGVFRMKGNLNVGALVGAFREVHAADPNLSGTIIEPTSKRPVLECGESSIPDIKIIDRSSEFLWQKESHTHVNEPFQRTTNDVGIEICKPLCSLTVIRGNDRHELIVRVHHAVCDGRRLLILIERMLSLYQARCSSNSRPPPQFGPARTLESHYGVSCRLAATARLVRESLSSAYWSCGKTATYESSFTPEASKSNLAFLTFEQESTTRLIKRCKEKQTTVNAALAAAEMQAFCELRNFSGNVSFQTTFDCPDRSIAESAESCVGTYSHSHTTWHQPSKHEFWDLADRYRRNLLKRQRTNAVPPLGFSHLARGFLLANTRGGQFAAVADLCLSNLGRVDIPTDYGELQLRELFFASSQTRLGGNAVINAGTTNGQLSLTCVTPAHIAPGFGDEMLSTMIRILRIV